MNGVMDVVAGILVRGDLVLAAKRSASMRWSGFWEFPGGKVEADETLDQALIRELREELNIVVRAFYLWKVKEKTDRGTMIRLYFYLVTAFDGTPTPNEGQELSWFNAADAAGYEFLPADQEVLVDLVSTSLSGAPFTETLKLH